MNGGANVLIWYVVVIVVAFCVSLFYYLQLIGDPAIKAIYM